MALTIPSGTLYMTQQPYDNTYKDTKDFTDSAAQQAYFRVSHSSRTNSNPKPTLVFDNLNYSVPSGNVVRIQLTPAQYENADIIGGYNYLMFNNRPNNNGKWFYCFILDFRYVNENCVDVVYEIDVMQTFFCRNSDGMRGYANIMRGMPRKDYDFVKDSYGLHYEVDPDNNSDRLPLKVVEPVQALAEDCSIEESEFGRTAPQTAPKLWNYSYYLLATRYPNDDPETTGIRFTTTGSGQWALPGIVYEWSDRGPALAEIIRLKTLEYSTNGRTEDLIGGLVFVNDAIGGRSERYHYRLQGSEPNRVSYRKDDPSHYVPRNAKLFMYPFTKLRMNNPLEGQLMEYAYEDFRDGYGLFDVYFTLLPRPSILFKPINRGYRESQTAGLPLVEGFTLSNFPNTGINASKYLDWLYENSTAIAFAQQHIIKQADLAGEKYNLDSWQNTLSMATGISSGVAQGAAAGAAGGPVGAGVGAIAGGILGGVNHLNDQARTDNAYNVQRDNFAYQYQLYENTKQIATATPNKYTPSSGSSLFFTANGIAGSRPENIQPSGSIVKLNIGTMRIIDRYFSLRGYSLGIPGSLNEWTKSRTAFNYVECSDVKLPDIHAPYSAVVKISNILNKGITFWHGNYDPYWLSDITNNSIVLPTNAPENQLFDENRASNWKSIVS